VTVFGKVESFLIDRNNDETISEGFKKRFSNHGVRGATF
jgi:hypothetical protein